ncbi:MAG: RNA 2',3'-cyclic phosphodiesterase [Thermoanaerobaculales bacterium]|jgi:2'-5' RNA ligase|nr:RNA 2',3'-cyclic phosphodiesterase [Thermoanaerobaculales bacterium]
MSGPGAHRAFVALDLPPETRELIRREQERLRRELPRARWTRPEGQHLTLKFLGDTPKAVVAELAAALAAAAAGRSPVVVTLGGSGFFPGPQRPRVAWVGGRAPGAGELAAAVDDAAVAIGLAAERRPWSLHLTQARLDRPWPPAAVERFLEWGRGFSAPSFACAEVVVFASELRPGGAVYTALERVPLR